MPSRRHGLPAAPRPNLSRSLSIGLAVAVLVGLSIPAPASPPSFPFPGGPYLGQPLPGREPEPFAPGLINVGVPVRDVAISPDGDEIYFGTEVGGFSFSTIMVTRRVGGVWTEPAPLPFMDTPGAMNMEPCLSPDGRRLFFFSTRPRAAGEEPGNQDIWVMERAGDSWGEPGNLGEPVCTDDSEYFPSVTRDGTIYFTRNPKAAPREAAIWRARWRDGAYQAPEKLPAQVNCGTTHYNAFVAPDESYVIVPTVGRTDGLGGTDYYVVFRNPDDTWQEPVNLGAAINTPDRPEWSPYVSPDGRCFFFMTSRFDPTWREPGAVKSWQDVRRMFTGPGNGYAQIWWVDASVVHELRRPGP